MKRLVIAHTPLHYAAMSGSTDIVKALIEAGATIEDGYTPSNLADLNGYTEIVKLLSAKANANKEEVSNRYKSMNLLN